MKQLNRLDVIKHVHVTEKGLNGAILTIIDPDSHDVVQRLKLVMQPAPVYRTARYIDTNQIRIILREYRPDILTVYCNILGTTQYTRDEDGTYSVQEIQPKPKRRKRSVNWEAVAVVG